MRNLLRALRCRVGRTPGHSVVWLEEDGQFWAAHECALCGQRHRPHPVAGLKITPERVPFERERIELWKWGAL